MLLIHNWCNTNIKIRQEVQTNVDDVIYILHTNFLPSFKYTSLTHNIISPTT